MAEQCKHRLLKGWHHYQCKNKAKRDGYCMVHHPDKVAARQQQQREKWQQQTEAQEQQHLANRRKTIRNFLCWALDNYETDQLMADNLLELVEEWPDA